jgi:ribonuclease T1
MRVAVAVLLALAALVMACSPADPTGGGAGVGPAETAGPPAPAGMPVVQIGELPPEAAATLVLIDAGGPFPYRQDGATFENREGLLPDRPAGHYREYTVPTPGEDDRGARRIVTGADGERYWTPDHYASFAWIAP